jgi:hypothetical protein
MLIYALDDLTHHLSQIMRACLVYGYVPQKWREMKIVFIPKPGKDSYQRVASWRPISLTSFLLKLLERLVDWHLRTPELIGSLKAHGQFAYLRGVSTDAALHNYIARMEKTLTTRAFAIGVFLDIEGAFSQATFKSLVQAMGNFGVDSGIIRWIKFMLETRSAQASAMGITRHRAVERGCPQGGVLSPLLWNLLVDGVLALLRGNYPQVYSQGFADDIGLLQSGIDPATVRNIMQQTLHLISRWCTKVDLSVNPDKIIAIVITQKKKHNVKRLRLNGIDITYKEQARYLGIILGPVSPRAFYHLPCNLLENGEKSRFTKTPVNGKRLKV